MPRRRLHEKHTPPTWEERIRGLTSVTLCIGSFALGAQMTDEKWVAACVIAGLLYMLTTIAIVFEKVDTIDS